MKDKPLMWLHGEVRSPPFSQEARTEAGYLLKPVQRGESLGLPRSRPMPSIGSGCHELRINEASGEWRIVYKSAPEAVIVLEVFKKTSRSTPRPIVIACRSRLRRYEGIR